MINWCLLLCAYWYLKKTATPVPLGDRKVPNSAVAATAAGLVAATRWRGPPAELCSAAVAVAGTAAGLVASTLQLPISCDDFPDPVAAQTYNTTTVATAAAAAALSAEVAALSKVQNSKALPSNVRRFTQAKQRTAAVQSSFPVECRQSTAAYCGAPSTSLDLAPSLLPG